MRSNQLSLQNHNIMKKEKNQVVNPVKFEGVSFYPASVKGKTLEEFQKHESHVGLSKSQLAEAYEILTKTKIFTTGVIETKDSEVVHPSANVAKK